MARTLQQRGSISDVGRRAAGAALAFAVALLLAVVATRSVQAQTYSVLYSFTGAVDGGSPAAGLIRDAAGNLYGTTSEGGDLACDAPYGCGTVFKLDMTGKETVLHSFTGADGRYPRAGLIRDAAGNLYGTTFYGGDLACDAPYGCGTVFKLDTTGMETVMHSFNGADGKFSDADLVRDASGNLYGTTYQGGGGGRGTVFKLDTNGTETVLYSFARTPDGKEPATGLVRDAAGNLYGTTYEGGSGYLGTVFKLDTTGTETVLHSFTGKDGYFPVASLVRDAAGNLYGTTEFGGPPPGYGTVFKLDTTGTETILYRFTNSRDGGLPESGLIRDAAGDLYGTTSRGGARGYGTVFKLGTTGTETVLHSFRGRDGATPLAGLIRDAAGNLYGTTVGGGTSGHGTVFKLTP